MVIHSESRRASSVQVLISRGSLSNLLLAGGLAE
jgi:hypothetical protein